MAAPPLRCRLRSLAHAPWGALAHLLGSALRCTALAAGDPRPAPRFVVASAPSLTHLGVRSLTCSAPPCAAPPWQPATRARRPASLSPRLHRPGSRRPESARGEPSITLTTKRIRKTPTTSASAATSRGWAVCTMPLPLAGPKPGAPTGSRQHSRGPPRCVAPAHRIARFSPCEAAIRGRAGRSIAHGDRRQAAERRSRNLDPAVRRAGRIEDEAAVLERTVERLRGDTRRARARSASSRRRSGRPRPRARDGRDHLSAPRRRGWRPDRSGTPRQAVPDPAPVRVGLAGEGGTGWGR